MVQRTINLRPRLVYSPETFVPHQGVAGVLVHCQSVVRMSGFCGLVIRGAARSGKTHLLLSLIDTVRAVTPRSLFISGQELAERLKSPCPLNAKLVVVDDLDSYLLGVQNGESGPFVNFFEYLKLAGAKLIASVNTESMVFNCDQHILTRLALLSEELIGPPNETQMKKIIGTLAMQRGIKLPDKKLDYLVKRLGLSISVVEEYLERLDYLACLFGSQINAKVISKAI